MKKAKRRATIHEAVRKSGTNKWLCYFCLDAVEFTSYEAALEHGQSCPSRSLVEWPAPPVPPASTNLASGGGTRARQKRRTPLISRTANARDNPSLK